MTYTVFYFVHFQLFVIVTFSHNSSAATNISFSVSDFDIVSPSPLIPNSGIWRNKFSNIELRHEVWGRVTLRRVGTRCNMHVRACVCATILVHPHRGQTKPSEWKNCQQLLPMWKEILRRFPSLQIGPEEGNYAKLSTLFRINGISHPPFAIRE